MGIAEREEGLKGSGLYQPRPVHQDRFGHRVIGETTSRFHVKRFARELLPRTQVL